MTATLVGLVRGGALDAELGALLWLVARGRVPVHVVSPDARDAAPVAESIAALAPDEATISTGSGSGIEDVLRLPVPLRPATGVVVVLDGHRVVAAHLHRPPLRDVAGHVRPQAPAVLAAWDERGDGWDHYAWGIWPEIAAALQRPAGDVEIDHARRREYLEALVRAPLEHPADIAAALAGFGVATPRA